MVFSIQLVPISEFKKYIPSAVREKKQEVGALSDSRPLLEQLDAPVPWHIFKPRIFKVAYYVNVTREHFVVLFHKNKPTISNLRSRHSPFQRWLAHFNKGIPSSCCPQAHQTTRWAEHGGGDSEPYFFVSLYKCLVTTMTKMDESDLTSKWIHWKYFQFFFLVDSLKICRVWKVHSRCQIWCCCLSTSV